MIGIIDPVDVVARWPITCTLILAIMAVTLWSVILVDIIRRIRQC